MELQLTLTKNGNNDFSQDSKESYVNLTYFNKSLQIDLDFTIKMTQDSSSKQISKQFSEK